MTETSPIHIPADAKDNKVEVGELHLDLAAGKASLEARPLTLTKTEFRVLGLLLQSDGRTFTREEILAAVHGDDYPVTARALDNHIVALRKKLGAYGNLIETVRGIGFRRRMR